MKWEIKWTSLLINVYLICRTTASKYCNGCCMTNALSLLCVYEVYQGKQFEVQKHKDLLTRALKCAKLALTPGVTPYNLCKNCNRSLKDAVSGRSIKSSLSMQDWCQCSSNCLTCVPLSKRKSGGSDVVVSNSESFSLQMIPLLRL